MTDATRPVVKGCSVNAEAGYSVTWPDGTCAWWLYRWQAWAARAGWTPPINGAFPVPDKPFHYEGQSR